VKSGAVTGLCWVFLILVADAFVRVLDESFGAQFVGNPLLILAALIVIAVFASLYHQIRK